MSRAIWTGLASVGALLLFGSCSADDTETEWGSAAESYFAEWDAAWSGADPYEVVRFYDADVAVGLAQDYRALTLSAGFRSTALPGDGRAWLARWIDKQYEPRQRSLQGLYVGRSVAVALITVDELETSVAVSMGVAENSIVSQTDLRWRDAHLPGGAPDDRLQWLDDMVATYVVGWTGADPGLAALYTEEATVAPFPDEALDLATALSSADLTYQQAEVTTVATGERLGPALFVGPDTATFALDATLPDGCVVQSMVLLTLEDQLITNEQRLITTDSVRRCYGDVAPRAGWWNTLSIPVAINEQVSGSVIASDGSEITIVNGTAELERLLEWGLDRFAAVDLALPRLASVTFAPVPACGLAPGLVTEAERAESDLVLCTDAYAACLPDRATCTEFRATDQLGLLHELGHAWLVDNIDDQAQNDFMAFNGLSSWRGGDLPWHRRGAEQAAEIMAWGLMDEPIKLLRIGDPPCADIAAGYTLLTGNASPHGCSG